MEKMVKQVIAKMELIVGVHKNILGNVKKTQQKQKKTYDLRKKNICF